MKLLIAFLITLPLMALASTSDEKSFLLSSEKTSHQLSLTTEKTHTEYRYERVRSTCTRTVYAGTYRVCNTRYQRRCSTGRNGSRVCRSVPVRSCRNVRRYRDETYTCYREVQVPYEVFDYYVDTQVKFNFDLSDVQNKTDINEDFKVTVYGDTVDLKVEDSKDFLILVTSRVSSSVSEGIKYLDKDYDIKLVSINTYNAIIMNDIQDIKLENNEQSILSFKIHKDTFKLFSAELSSFNRKFIFKKVYGFKGSLNSSNIILVPGENELVTVQVSLMNNSHKNSVKKQKINLKFKLDLKGYKLINSDIIGKKKFKVNKKVKFSKD